MKAQTSNLLRIAILFPALILMLAATQPLHAAPSSDDDAYADGTRAMNQQQWANAVDSFDKVINAHGTRVDAALYWKAYSLNKIGNKGLALATCFQLRQQFKDSTWNKDCSALSIDLNPNINTDVNIDPKAISDSIKLSVNPDAINASVKAALDQDGVFTKRHGHDHSDPNEEIKLLALNSLLRQDPSKALPILRDVLSGNSSAGMKRRAIFILAQNKSPEAQAILHDAVVGKMDPELQRSAIQSMAVFEGKRASDTFAEVYRNTNDPQIKHEIISAFFVSHDAAHLVDLARNEKDLNLKRDIVRQLAIMNDKVATDYMLELLK